ncbi:MAG TPA: sporulation protein YqfC [Calditerricola sp.]
MARWTRRLRRWAVQTLDLPDDALLDVPRVTMIGTFHAYIENHRGVLQFDGQELRLLLTSGQLVIRGKNLVLRAILPEELFVEGQIDTITFLK